MRTSQSTVVNKTPSNTRHTSNSKQPRALHATLTRVVVEVQGASTTAERSIIGFPALKANRRNCNRIFHDKKSESEPSAHKKKITTASPASNEQDKLPTTSPWPCAHDHLA